MRRAAVRWPLAALAGVVLGFAFPPYGFVPALVAWAFLLWLVRLGADGGRGWPDRLALGFLFGFGFHLMGLWWVGEAFLVDTDAHGVFRPLGVIGLPLVLAIFMALALVPLGLAPRAMAWQAVMLAAAVAAIELLRGVVFTGFPWNTAGIALTESRLFLQSAAVGGLSGLALAAVLLGTLPAVLFERRSRWLAVPIGAMLIAMTAFGAIRLWQSPSEPADDALLVRVVQPNVPQADKWNPALRDAIWSRLLSLTATTDDPGPDLVVWPETTIPFLWRTPSLEQFALADALGEDTILVTGAVEIEETDTGRINTNAVLVLGPDGTQLARYDKYHLVPFGEYLPFAGLLSQIGLEPLVEAAGTFSAGEGPRVLDVPGLPAFQPLICYEVIFPGLTIPGPAFLINVTNDAWFGDTPGPRQHLRHSVVRAVESGLPLVRAANTGISAVIDPTGRITARLAIDREGVIDARLPSPQNALYGRFGDYPVLALVALMAMASLWAKRIQRVP